MTEFSQHKTSRFKCKRHDEAHNIEKTKFKNKRRKDANRRSEETRKISPNGDGITVKAVVTLLINALSRRR